MWWCFPWQPWVDWVQTPNLFVFWIGCNPQWEGPKVVCFMMGDQPNREGFQTVEFPCWNTSMISLFLKPCSHFSLMSLPQFLFNLYFLPLPSILYSCFSRSTMMGEYSSWQWVLPPTEFGWPLGSCLLFHPVLSCIKDESYYPAIKMGL